MRVRKIRQKKNYLLPEMKNFLLFGLYNLESESGFEAFLIEPDLEKIKKIWSKSREQMLAFWPHNITPFAEAIFIGITPDKEKLKEFYEKEISHEVCNK